jgi:hypothetical protein
MSTDSVPGLAIAVFNVSLLKNSLRIQRLIASTLVILARFYSGVREKLIRACRMAGGTGPDSLSFAELSRYRPVL